MNAHLVASVPWTRSRWIYTVGAVFVLQIVLVFFLGERPRRLPDRDPFRTRVQMAPDDGILDTTSLLTDLQDPTLLALPTLSGFSGQAWLRFPPLEYVPEERIEGAYWLEPDSRSMGAALSRFLLTATILPPRVTDQPVPSTLRYDPNFPLAPIMSASRLRIEGGLAGRRLSTPLDLKSWEHSETLSDSVFEVMIDADGVVFSAVPLSESGLKKADDYALALINGARFEPLPRRARLAGKPQALVWGTLIFQWHTLPLPAGAATADIP